MVNLRLALSELTKNKRNPLTKTGNLPFVGLFPVKMLVNKNVSGKHTKRYIIPIGLTDKGQA